MLSLFVENDLCSFLENEVDEIIDAENDLVDNYAETERELSSADAFIDDDLDELITQADINMIQDELKDEYEAELLTDDEVENLDYTRDDDLENPFNDKPKSTIEDYLNDF